MEFNGEINSAFEQLLTSVRSVRRMIDFDRDVEDDVLLNCINIAVQAPTGKRIGIFLLSNSVKRSKPYRRFIARFFWNLSRNLAFQ